MEVKIKDFRCVNCGKLFFKADLFSGKIEVKCRNCKKIILIKGYKCELLNSLEMGKSLFDNNFLENKKNIDKALVKCMNCYRLGRCGYYIVIRKLCSF